MTIEQMLQLLVAGHDEEQTKRFLEFLSQKLWGQYDNYVMDLVKMMDGQLNWNLPLPNAKEGQPYQQTAPLPQVDPTAHPGVRLELVGVEGLNEEKHGLRLEPTADGLAISISGTPSLEAFRLGGAVPESVFDLTFTYRFTGGFGMPAACPVMTHTVPFVINQDPRKLWRNIPVDWDHMPQPRYPSPDTQMAYVKVEALPDGTPQKDIVAASKRGRSHAQEGKPRDDHFRVEHIDNGWYVMAVADGAGSMPYSREGSRIACEETVDFCLAKLAGNRQFEAAIEHYDAHRSEAESEARKLVGDYIYQIVGSAAFKAYKAIDHEANAMGMPIKAYATTLLLTICKRFSFGWFVASFWVGDGAICLYDRPAHTARILGVPDEGEFAGQTRFLTMSEIFKDSTSLYQRLRFSIVDDFTALILMTDGVSDPKFETDANLNNPDKWDALWDDLQQGGVELTDDNEQAQEQLLRWLDFWSPGNHDDRTIALLYGEPQAEAPAEAPAEALAEAPAEVPAEVPSIDQPTNE